MDQTNFVYSTHVHVTPEKIRQGLTDPVITRRFWGGVSFTSDREMAPPSRRAFTGGPPARLTPRPVPGVSPLVSGAPPL